MAKEKRKERKTKARKKRKLSSFPHTPYYYIKKRKKEKRKKEPYLYGKNVKVLKRKERSTKRIEINRFQWEKVTAERANCFFYGFGVSWCTGDPRKLGNTLKSK